MEYLDPVMRYVFFPLVGLLGWLLKEQKSNTKANTDKIHQLEIALVDKISKDQASAMMRETIRGVESKLDRIEDYIRENHK